MADIVTNRLTLRLFTEHDASEAFAAATPSVSRFMTWEPSISAEEFATVWRPWLSAMRAGSEFHFVIRANSEFAGLAGLHGLKESLPELGIWLKELAQGHGYGYEAIEALIVWASQTFGPSAFRWPVAVDNIRSRKLAEKLGGVPIGTYNPPKYAGVLYRIPATPSISN